MVYIVLFFTIAAGLLLISWRNQNDISSVTIYKKALEDILDYEKLEELAAQRPDGEKYLQFIRENEAVLLDRGGDVKYYGEGFITLGFNLHALHDDIAAVEAYKKGLEILPENSYGLNNIASSYINLGEYENAEEAYRKLTKVLSGDSSAVISHADVYKLLHPDDEEGFLRIVEEGIAVSSGEHVASLLSYVGWYFRDAGNMAKAIEYFEKLVEFFPENELYRLELNDLRKQQ